MHCEDARKMVLEYRHEVPLELRNHLASCPLCAADLRNYRTLQLGFRVLAEEPIPETSVGFAQRLLRKLDDAMENTWTRENFWELAGRRAVYATLLFTLMAILALVVPSRGPLRQPTRVSDVYPVEPVVMAFETDPVLSGDSSSPVTAPASGPAPPEGEGGRK